MTKPAPAPRPRLGSVPWLNAAPLTDGLRGLGCAVSTSLPSAIATEVRAGALDFGLVPAFEVLARPGWSAVEGVAIGSDGPVRSVLLHCRRDPSRIRRLRLDPASLSSNALALVVLAERHGIRPEILPAGDPDAVLVIGDPALRGLPGPWEAVVDLGAAWRDLTDLPFVFAVWATRTGHPGATRPGRVEATADLLREATRRGLGRLDAIAAAEGPPRGLSPEAALAYLRDAVRYTLGPRERAGLAAFSRLLKAHGLLEASHDPDWL